MADSFKNMWHEAAIGVRELLDGVVDNWKEDASKSTPDEALARYSMLHRNNPLALQEFVAKQVLNGRLPKGTNPITELKRYEEAMEGMMRQRQGRAPRRRR